MMCSLGSQSKRYKGLPTPSLVSYPSWKQIMPLVFFLSYHRYFTEIEANIDTHTCMYNFSTFVYKNYDLP